MDLNAPMHTERLLLRPVRTDDLAALIELKTEPQVARYLPHKALTAADVTSALQAELDHAESHDDTLLLGVQRPDEPALIGHVSIWPRQAEVPLGELMILIAPHSWCHGLGTEVCTAAISRWLTRFPGSTVYAAVHPENAACQALMRKIGLDHEVAGHEFPGIHADSERVFWSPTGDVEHAGRLLPSQ